MVRITSYYYYYMTATFTRSLVLVCVLLFAAFQTSAQVAATVRYQNSIRGGLAVAANSLVLRQDVFVNNSGGTTMSSYSDLVLPAGSTIVKAFLLIEGFPTNAASKLTSVKFKVPGAAAFTTLTPTSPGFIRNVIQTITVNGGLLGGGIQNYYYSQFSIDVTSMMPANGYVSTITAGGNAATTGRYTVADPAPSTPTNKGYGWSLMVVYSNPASKYRNVTIADAFTGYGGGVTTPVTTTVNNVSVPASGTVNAMVMVTGTWGDRTNATTAFGDKISFGKAGSALTLLSDPTTLVTNDAMNGTIGMQVPNNVTIDGVTGMVSGNYTARNPYNTFDVSGNKESYWFDCDVFNASGILAPSATPINAQVQVQVIDGDLIGCGAYGISIDIAPTKLTKLISPTTIPCGGTATYTFTITNTEPGAINQTNIGFTDNIPSGLVIANPNGVVVTGGSGAVVTAVAGTNMFTLSGLNLPANQTATITLNVTNVAGQYNASCASNPTTFTNGSANIVNNTSNLGNGVAPQCLIVTAPAIPTFAAVGPVCSGATLSALPTSSTNVPPITGTWLPALNNTTTTTYTFTPTAGQCASSTTLQIVVNPYITPTFNPIASFCEGTTAPSLPNPSTNATPISGTWAPTTINNTAGATYTFTATTAGCFNTATLTTTVTTAPTATFAALPSFCSGTTAPLLPTSSTNTPAITGTWTPALVNNTVDGTYTFTPDPGQCGVSTTLTSVIAAPVPVTLNPIASFCEGSVAPLLPATSADGKAGVWSPLTVANSPTGSTTYTFTPTAGQCAASNSISVTVTPGVPVTLNPITAFCEGTTAPTLPATSSDGKAGVWSPLTVSNTTSGTYTFTPTTGFCAVSASISITVNPAPPVVLTPIPPFCIGTAAPTLQVTSADNKTGSWAPTLVDNMVGGTYVFTPNPGQCAISASISVSLLPREIPTFDAMGPFCPGATVPSLPVNSNNSPTPFSGTWVPATINNAVGGTYTFTPNGTECATTASITIAITPEPTPTFTPVGPFCEGDAVPALQNPSLNAISGTWMPTTISATTGGTYTFTPNAGVCATSATLTVVINAKEVPTFEAIPPFCAGETPIPSLPTASIEGVTGTWVASTINNMIAGTYTFTPVAGQCYTTATLLTTLIPPTVPTFTTPPAICAGDVAPILPLTSNNGIDGTWASATVDNMNTATYTFTPDAGECATTATLVVTVNPKPTPTFTPIPPICGGGAAPTLQTPSIEGIAGTWSPGVVDNTTTKTYTFTPAVGVCATTAQIIVTVGPPQPAVFAQIPPFCSGSTAPILATTSDNGVSGTWAPSIVNTTTSGTYIFTPTAGLCAESTDMNITVTPKENPTFTPVGPFCKGEVIAPLTTTSNAPESVVGSWLPAVVDNQNTTTYTFTPAGTECANTAVLTITINPATTPTFTAPAAFCAGGTAPILSVVSGNNINGTWAPIVVDNMNTATYTFTPTAGQCAETTTLEVLVNSSITITANDVTTCANVPIQLDATGGGAGATYVWTPATGLDNPNIANPKATTLTSRTYHVEVTTPSGCKGSDDVTVTIASGLTITVDPPSANICNGGSVTLTASGAANYTWSLATGLNTTSGATVIASPTVTTTYTIDGNTGGCLGQTTVIVTVGDPVPATFAQIPPFCAGTTAPVLLPNSTNNPAVSGTWTPATVNNTTSGSYTFTPTAGACALGTVMDIVVNPTPAFGDVTATCDGTNTNYVLVVDLVGGTQDFTLTANAPSTGISGTFNGNQWTSNPIVSGVGYNLDFVDANGCGPVNVTGIKNCNCATAVGTMTHTLIELCQGATATATYATAGENLDGNDAKEFVLHTNAGGTLGTIISRSATPTFSFNAGTMTFGTTYYISAIVGDNSGGGTVDITDDCLALAIGQPVKWNATPTATANNNGPLCIGDALNLTGTGNAIPADPAMKFDWTFANGSNSTAQNPTITAVTAADNGTYTLIVTANNCPSAPVTTSVVVNPPPVATPSSNSPICAGATLNLIAQTVPGATYNWTGGLTSSTQNPSVVNAQAVNAGTYSLQVTLGGCKSPKVDINVVVNAVPLVSVNLPTVTLCAGSDTTLVASGATTYSWTPTTDIAPTSGSSVVIIANSNITYTLTGTTNGCTATATSIVTVNSIPVMTTITDIQACEGGTVAIPAFNSTPAGGTTYTWSAPNGMGVGMSSISGNTSIGSFIGTSNGAITQANVSVTPKRNGCAGLPDNFLITVNPLPSVSALSNVPCEGSALNLSAPLPVIMAPSYAWTHANGYAANGQSVTISNVTQADAGVYTVLVTDAVGCQNTATTTVAVTAPSVPNLTGIQFGPFCENISAPQTIPADLNLPGDWSTTVGGSIVNNQFTPSIAGAATHTFTYTPTAFCSVTGTISVVVNPMPTVPLTVSAPGCGPLTVNFTTAPGMDLTTWIFGDGTSSNDATGSGAISNVFSNSGFYDVTVTNELNGCITTQTFTDAVEVYADPVANFNVKEKLLYITDPTAIINNNSSGAVSYDWDFGDNSTSTVTNPTHTYDEVVGTYTILLTAVSAHGCVDETSQTIQIKDQLLFFIPNAFTPDGNQHNNTFQPVFTSGFDAQNFVIYIYNRWGEIIFESHNTEVGWDGTYHDEVVQEGIYQWVLEVKDPNSDNKFNFQGHVFLVR